MQYETLTMVTVQVFGNDHSVTFADSRGFLTAEQLDAWVRPADTTRPRTS